MADGDDSAGSVVGSNGASLLLPRAIPRDLVLGVDEVGSVKESLECVRRGVEGCCRPLLLDAGFRGLVRRVAFPLAMVALLGWLLMIFKVRVCFDFSGFGLILE